GSAHGGSRSERDCLLLRRPRRRTLFLLARRAARRRGGVGLSRRAGAGRARAARRSAARRACLARRRDRRAPPTPASLRLLRSRGRPGAVIMNALKLRDIAERLHCRLDGDGDLEIVRVAGIGQAQPGDLTFVANAKYLSQLATTRASAVIIGDANGSGPRPRCAVLHADDPYSAFARAVALFA